jgi:hypothetical protein
MMVDAAQPRRARDVCREYVDRAPRVTDGIVDVSASGDVDRLQVFQDGFARVAGTFVGSFTPYAWSERTWCEKQTAIERA